jgi:transposase
MEILFEDYDFYVKPGATDMRKCSPSLALIVQYEMKLEPFAKAVFLFCGGTKRTIKAIVWDRNGWIEIIKRLECGSSFKWPNTEEEALQIEISDLLLLLKGYDVFRRFPVLSPRYVG